MEKIMRKSTEVEREAFALLDALRESGIVNVFGASGFLLDNMEITSKKEAHRLMVLWMHNFNPDGEYDIIEAKQPKV